MNVPCAVSYAISHHMDREEREARHEALVDSYRADLTSTPAKFSYEVVSEVICMDFADEYEAALLACHKGNPEALRVLLDKALTIAAQRKAAL